MIVLVVVVVIVVVEIMKLLFEISGLSMLLYSGALSLTRLRRRRRMVVEMRKKTKGNPSRLTSRLMTEHTLWATNPL